MKNNCEQFIHSNFLSCNGPISKLAALGIVGARRELCAGHGAAFSARQGTESEDSNPSTYHPKPGAIGRRVAAHPAAPVQRQALSSTVRSLANLLVSAVQALPATKMH